MRVQMRIRKALHRSRCEVNELRPNHVARYPVLVRPFRPHPRFNFRLDLPHRLVHRMLERLQNALIPRELINHGNRLWTMEIEVIPDDSIALVPLRQPFIRTRPPVLTQCFKCRLCHQSRQSQFLRCHTLPLTRDFLALRVVILPLQ